MLIVKLNPNGLKKSNSKSEPWRNLRLFFLLREKFSSSYGIRPKQKEKYDGYFEENLEYERNGWAGHCDRSDRTDNWSGHLGPGEAVPAVEELRI